MTAEGFLVLTHHKAPSLLDCGLLIFTFVRRAESLHLLSEIMKQLKDVVVQRTVKRRVHFT